MKKIMLTFTLILTILVFSGCVWSPSVPKELFPVSGTTGLGSEVKLNWETIHPGANWITVKYDLYFSEEQEPAIYAQNLTESTYTLKNLKASTIYYWKIMVKNITQGTYSVSEIHNFKTQ